jgi:hypothetical protein
MDPHGSHFHHFPFQQHRAHRSAQPLFPNVSSDNMSIKPEPPTGKIMLLSTSVIRQKRPDLRRGISVRIPTKALRNFLRVISLRLLIVRGRVRRDSLFARVLHRPLFAFPTTYLSPAPQVLAPTGSNEQRASFIRSRARFQAGRASRLCLYTFSSRNPLSKPDKRKAQNFWRQFE